VEARSAEARSALAAELGLRRVVAIEGVSTMEGDPTRLNVIADDDVVPNVLDLQVRPTNAERRPARLPRGETSRGAARAGRRVTRYSTVTVFARLRGWSTFRPRRRAIR
jgi:hypothetical protein